MPRKTIQNPGKHSLESYFIYVRTVITQHELGIAKLLRTVLKLLIRHGMGISKSVLKSHLRFIFVIYNRRLNLDMPSLIKKSPTQRSKFTSLTRLHKLYNYLYSA